MFKSSNFGTSKPSECERKVFSGSGKLHTASMALRRSSEGWKLSLPVFDQNRKWAYSLSKGILRAVESAHSHTLIFQPSEYPLDVTVEKQVGSPGGGWGNYKLIPWIMQAHFNRWLYIIIIRLPPRIFTCQISSFCLEYNWEDVLSFADNLVPHWNR